MTGGPPDRLQPSCAVSIPLAAPVDGLPAVSGRIDEPPTAAEPDPGARRVYVFAHGAGAGMDHPGMALLAQALATRGLTVLRWQFPFMERGSRRPDSPRVAQAAVSAAVNWAAERWPGAALFAGGRSFGGRMTSQAQAAGLLPALAGLVFVGFPLHPAGKPSLERGAHLADVTVPMLFLQGDRDALADPPLLERALQPLGRRATLDVYADADHGFHVRRRSGQTDDAVREKMATAIVRWCKSVTANTPDSPH